MLFKLVNRRPWLILVTILFTLRLPGGIVYAQESYRTLLGTVVISTEVNNETVKYISNDLDVQLNYETAEFTFSLNKNDIRTENILHLNLYKPEMIKFYGKLGVDFIKTDSHPIQIFGVEGTLSSLGGREISLNASGSLSHLYSNTDIACLLNISIQIDRQEIEGFILDSASTSDMKIEITNTILDEN